MTSAMLFLLLGLAWTAAAAVTLPAGPPRCRLIGLRRQYDPSVADKVMCSCRSSANATYIGNLNFLKVHLGPVRLYNRSVDITLDHCDQLELELNLAEVAPNKPVNLRIHESSSVKINEIRVGAVSESQQSIILQNVTMLLVSGRISCTRCPSDQGSLHFQFRNVSHVIMEGVEAGTAVKMSGHHLGSVYINNTTLSSVPWPGIFIHNVSRVSITNSMLPDLGPKSISLTKGDKVNVSHNLLDVISALNLLQFRHVNVKCNRRHKTDPLPADCRRSSREEVPQQDQVINYRSQQDVAAGDEVGGPDPVQVEDSDWSPGNHTIITTGLLVIDAYGLAFITLALILVLLFLIVVCICSIIASRRERRGNKSAPSEDPEQEEEEQQGVEGGKVRNLLKRTKQPPLGSSLAADTGMLTALDADEYSNSSRAHLAQGVDQDPVLLRYVRVQGVRSEEGEGGIVCGSLTLGPSYNPKESQSSRVNEYNRLKHQTFSKV